MNAAPFFLVGSGRSGTTLLRLILASHSRIAIPPETYYLSLLVEQLRMDRPLAPDEVERAVQIMVRHYRWPDMGFDADLFRHEALALEAPYLRDVVEIVYRRYVQGEGKRRWGDKTPSYIRILPQLAALFPGSRFIHLVRDGRDVAMSFQSVGWYGKRLHDNTREWNEALDFYHHWMESCLKNRLHEVRYEDLVLDTERTVRGVCLFLGEEFEPRMLSWEGKVDRLVPTRERYFHEKLKRRPNAEDVERWKREMTPWEVFVAEAFMGRNLERSGYRRRYGNPLWAPVFVLARWYCRLVLPALGRLKRMALALRAPQAPSGEGRSAGVRSRSGL